MNASIAPGEVVGIIGFGNMGRGIARACVSKGFHVLVSEIDPVMGRKNLDLMKSELQARVKKGKMTESDFERTMSFITLIDDMQGYSKASVVIEAITENQDMKAALYKELERRVSPEVPIATNTSSLSVSELSRNLMNRRRFGGMHFFNPADVMRLVEVVRGEETSDETLSFLSSFATQLGKTPLQVPDIAGFYVNRILFPLLIEGIRVLEQKGTSAKDIDEALKLGGNLPMGPLELCDFIGNDVVLSICESLLSRTSDPRFTPPSLLRDIVKQGKLGRKTGAGFHSYR